MIRTRSLCLAALLLLGVLAGCRSAQTTSAILYMEEQKYDKAVKALHEALEYNPKEADAFYYLGEAHTKLAEVAITENKFADARKNYEMAYGYYKQAAQLDPAQFKDNVGLAILHNYTLRNNDAKTEYNLKYYEPAEGFFRLAYAAEPDSIAPIKNIAFMKIKQAGENNNDPVILGQAVELLDQVIKVRPDAFELLADKATVLGKLGRTQEAAQLYDKLMTDHPKDASLVAALANIAVQDKKFERAAELVTKLIELYQTDSDPDNDAEIKNLTFSVAGWLSQDEIHRYPESIEWYNKALALELVPERETLVGLLLTHYKYGNILKDEAAAATDPARKAELQAQTKAQFTEAVSVGTKAVDQFFDCANCYLVLSRCQFELGDATAGEANIKKYEELQNQAGGSAGGGQ
jgi:tetratricopeptide (TPR) repeat protein